MDRETPARKPTAPPPAPGAEVPFGVNEVRLTGRHWLVAAGLVLLVALLAPRLWEKLERFETGPDYRLPYELSKDYWLYGRRLRQVPHPEPVFLLGDSVVWGEYVLPDGTLSHFLNRAAGETDRFVNGGVNGLFPLALEGLVRDHGRSLRRQRVIVHCNLLWLTSPKADLSTDQEEPFNHARLVPQFHPRIPCYRAEANERLAAVVERQIEFLAWANHLRDAYFGQQSIPQWTLQEDGSDPPRRPNAYRRPWASITLTVPGGPSEDPQRGPHSPRHKPWSTNAAGTTHFEWVRLERSLQWQALQRVLALLRERGHPVLVVVGPFNEHMLAEENRAAYREIRDGIAGWLERNHVPHIVPDLLPSALYADASHPLTEGYRLIAEQICRHARFQSWAWANPAARQSVLSGTQTRAVFARMDTTPGLPQSRRGGHSGPVMEGRSDRGRDDERPCDASE